MSATLLLFFILKCLFHLYLSFLYCKVFYFSCIKVSLVVKDPKSIVLN